MVFGKLEKYKSPDIDQIPEYLIQAEAEDCFLCSINLVNLSLIKKTFIQLKDYIVINLYLFVFLALQPIAVACSTAR
jgi:hypothetical protein